MVVLFILTLLSYTSLSESICCWGPNDNYNRVCCVGTCQLQNCATGYCNAQTKTCVCSRCENGPPWGFGKRKRRDANSKRTDENMIELFKEVTPAPESQCLVPINSTSWKASCCICKNDGHRLEINGFIILLVFGVTAVKFAA